LSGAEPSSTAPRSVYRVYGLVLLAETNNGCTVSEDKMDDEMVGWRKDEMVGWVGWRKRASRGRSRRLM
jgi:hypothetical protein